MKESNIKYFYKLRSNMENLEYTIKQIFCENFKDKVIEKESKEDFIKSFI